MSPGACTFNETLAGCTKIDAIPERDMRPIKGVKICGFENGTNFLESKRPGIDGKCPGDYKACNPAA